MNITLGHSEIKVLLKFIVDKLPERKIEQIKELRAITGLGLKESKDLIEAEWERRGPPACPITRVLLDIQVRRDNLRGTSEWDRDSVF